MCFVLQIYLFSNTNQKSIFGVYTKFRAVSQQTIQNLFEFQNFYIFDKNIGSTKHEQNIKLKQTKMKKLVQLFALLLVLSSQISCAQANKETVDKKNKKIVVDFYQRLFGDKDITAIDDYLVENYIQHNPGASDGRQALKDFFMKLISNQPKTKINFLKVVSDGDLVVLHMKVKSFISGNDASLIDIFRVKDGKIVEHWDIIQDVPEKAANAHPMF